jgi:hypothetical protein
MSKMIARDYTPRDIQELKDNAKQALKATNGRLVLPKNTRPRPIVENRPLNRELVSWLEHDVPLGVSRSELTRALGAPELPTVPDMNGFTTVHLGPPRHTDVSVFHASRKPS